MDNWRIPPVLLYNNALRWVKETKYLGVMLSHDGLDNADIKRQLRAIYACGNLLIRKFQHLQHRSKMLAF
jgi:hypothetical protein